MSESKGHALVTEIEESLVKQRRKEDGPTASYGARSKLDSSCSMSSWVMEFTEDEIISDSQGNSNEAKENDDGREEIKNHQCNAKPKLSCDKPKVNCLKPETFCSGEIALENFAANMVFNCDSTSSYACASKPAQSELRTPDIEENFGEECSDQEEKVDTVIKTKLMSMWNNMKYGWTVKTKTSFKTDSVICVLGNIYHKKLEDSQDNKTYESVERVTRQKSNSINRGFDQFKGDFFSRLWFTYRREFPVLSGSSFTSDCGWGCMLRSGQMMLGQAFLTHYLSRQWNWYDHQPTYQNFIHRQIIRLFGDVPSKQSPFSIHHLVSIGQKSGKKVGDWYGPASVAHIFKQAMEMAYVHEPVSEEVGIYVAQDCTIYKADILEICRSHPCKKWRGVIIFVPVRLGSEKLNPIYINCIKAIFAQETCIGIIGGKPKHSLYFIGWQDESLIYLDPHYCQPMVEVLSDDFPMQSFHCDSPRKMHISKMDPSCTIGFYCKTEENLNFFLSTITEVLAPAGQKSDYPIFIVCEGSAIEARGKYGSSCDEMDGCVEERTLKITHRYCDDSGNTKKVVSSEEFVIL